MMLGKVVRGHTRGTELASGKFLLQAKTCHHSTTAFLDQLAWPLSCSHTETKSKSWDSL